MSKLIVGAAVATTILAIWNQDAEGASVILWVAAIVWAVGEVFVAND